MTGGPETADGPEATVPADLVQAALRAAAEFDRQVADVPVAAIAAQAGISRSTLLRRLGGSRALLDNAVRAAGIDPGGQPVRVRALDAAAELISESGLAGTTMGAIAARADCSADSLYANFGSRDDLLSQVFERHNPIVDIDDELTAGLDDLTGTVRHVYRLIAEALDRQPRVGPAILAEALARPTSPAVRSVTRYAAPRMLAVLGRWFTAEIEAGRMRDVPVPLLIHQFAAPVVVHLLLRPIVATAFVADLPDIAETCDIFADAFVRAVAVDPADLPARR